MFVNSSNRTFFGCIVSVKKNFQIFNEMPLLKKFLDNPYAGRAMIGLERRKQFILQERERDKVTILEPNHPHSQVHTCGF